MDTGSDPDLSANDSSFWPNVHCNQGLCWTCAVQKPSFQGRCGSNPCEGAGCPSSELYPATFSTIPASLSPPGASILTSMTTSTIFSSSTSITIVSSQSSSPLPSGSSLSLSSSLTAASSPSSTALSPTSSTATAQPAITTSISSSSPNVGAIAEGTPGGAVFLILMGIIFYLLLRLRQRRYAVHSNGAELADPNHYSKLPTFTRSCHKS